MFKMKELKYNNSFAKAVTKKVSKIFVCLNDFHLTNQVHSFSSSVKTIPYNLNGKIKVARSTHSKTLKK